MIVKVMLKVTNSKSDFEFSLKNITGRPVAFQSVLKRIQHLTPQYVRLILVVVDSIAAVSVEPEFPLRSK